MVRGMLNVDLYLTNILCVKFLSILLYFLATPTSGVISYTYLWLCVCVPEDPLTLLMYTLFNTNNVGFLSVLCNQLVMCMSCLALFFFVVIIVYLLLCWFL